MLELVDRFDKTPRGPQKHRKAPDLPFQHAPSGTCRLCGGHTPKGRPKWHEECHDRASCAWFPNTARHFVFARDHGRCCLCAQVLGIPWRGYGERVTRNAEEVNWMAHSMQVRGWAVDHVVPLWMAPREFRYWTPWNLWLLCDACHRRKTTMEAGMRARVRGLSGHELGDFIRRYRRFWRTRSGTFAPLELCDGASGEGTQMRFEVVGAAP